MDTAAEVVGMYHSAGQRMTSDAAMAAALRLADLQVERANGCMQGALGEINETALAVAGRLVVNLPPEARGPGWALDEMAEARLQIAGVWGCLHGMSMQVAKYMEAEAHEEAEHALNKMAALCVGLRSLQDKVQEYEEKS